MIKGCGFNQAFAFAFFCFTLIVYPMFADVRTWTGKNGVTIAAELVGVSDDGKFASLRTLDGFVKQGALSQLSDQDQQFVKEYEEQQKVNGLVKFRGQWLSRTKIQEIISAEREKEYLVRAEELVMSKAKPKVPFMVVQALPEGALCVMGKTSADGNQIFYSGEFFLLIGATSKTLADEEEYLDDLYWAGTFTYMTVKKIEKTVNSYSFDKSIACVEVRKKFGLQDTLESNTTVSSTEAASTTDKESTHSHEELKGFASGFIITKDGYLLTNYHVVKNAKGVKVKMEKGVFSASIIAKDPDNDIALLKMEGEFPFVEFNKEKCAKLGQTVFTVGFPMPEMQGLSPKVTKGVVSSLNGMQDDVRMYQIDAAVQPGNSGGPLADENGNIIGVVVARLNDSYVAESTGSLPQNINYAVKKSYLLAFVDNNPEASKQIQTATEQNNVSFEEAVDKVRRATVCIVVY